MFVVHAFAQNEVEHPNYWRSSFGLMTTIPNPDNSDQVETGLKMAATVVVTVPLFLLFVFFRKYIMKGVGRAGIKG